MIEITNLNSHAFEKRILDLYFRHLWFIHRLAGFLFGLDVHLFHILVHHSVFLHVLVEFHVIGVIIIRQIRNHTVSATASFGIPLIHITLNHVFCNRYGIIQTATTDNTNHNRYQSNTNAEGYRLYQAFKTLLNNHRNIRQSQSKAEKKQCKRRIKMDKQRTGQSGRKQ